MKNFSKLLYISMVALAISSCNPSDFGDINENPNGTTVPVTSALLTNALSGLGTVAADTRGGLYCQYFSETQYTDVSLYALPQVAWDGIYAGSLNDLQNIISINSDPTSASRVTIDGSNANQIAVARIVKAYRMSFLTDQYGDIPYSEALQGNNAPKYDTQQEIYRDIFKELKEAAAQFDNGTHVNGDILYGGDNAHWVKFANSLRLILAMRLSKIDAATAQAELGTLGPVFESNADNATLNYPGGGFKNPWYALYDGRKDYAVSETITSLMYDLSDPRVRAFGYQADPNKDVVGFPYGLTRDDAIAFSNANSDWGYILDVNLRQANSPYTILSYADVLLAKAEAAQRGWISGDAKALYEAGIAASWEYWGVFDQTAFDNYIASTAVDLAGGNELEKIGVQRWLAFYPNGAQGWAEWRRTGFPTSIVPTAAAINSSKQIPRRYPYPTTEASLNKVGYTDAVSRLTGGDNADSRVWWDN